MSQLQQQSHPSRVMAPSLRRLLLLFLFLLLHHHAAAGPVFSDLLYPNFSASSVDYLEKGGVFLTSLSMTFSAVLSSNSPQSPFVFSVVHYPTSTVVWSANARQPAPYTGSLSLSASGLSISSSSNGSIIWSTQRLPRPVVALRLLDSGNLLLLDAANASLWQSFEHPTDTLLSSQRLPSGAYLSTVAADYRLLVTDGDAALLWSSAGGQQFWRLSADPHSIKDLNDAVAYMAADESGLYLFSAGGKAVFGMTLQPTKLRVMRLESDGRFRVMSYSGNGSKLEETLVAPEGDCDRPSSCNELEVCTTESQGPACNCAAWFASSRGGVCAPSDGSTLFSTAACGGNSSKENSVELAYRSLGDEIEYFANKFASPASTGGNISSCESLCTGNCSCLGFFFQNSSESCYLINNQLGCFVNSTNNGVFDSGVGYIKVLASPRLPTDSGGSSSSSNLLPILLPSIAVFLLILIIIFAGSQWWRRRRRRHGGKRRSRSTPSTKPSTMKEIYLGQNQPWSSHPDDRGSADDSSDSDPDEILIPGLPTRFTFTDLVVATNNFSTKIGSGGFGEVFRGTLPDNSLVAVKRISAGVGGSIHGKKEFCTEIAVISNIHHVNLVRLRGFCAEGRRRLLVYEYMNRGSLERSIFGSGGPVLEWQERMDIAVGAARGLAYLHSGCDHKIVHCDVKPENILLHDGSGVKISDFGLAKLISPEQSGLFTTMRGTRGYLAPEWLTNSAISDRTDVYSYGMVLLEIIRGRKNRSFASSAGGGGEGLSSGSSAAGGDGYFPIVALEMHERGRYLELADPRLEGRVADEEMELAVKVALCCLHEDPALRPTMAAVVAMLDGTVAVMQPRPEALSFLRLYGRGFIDSERTGTGIGIGEMVTGTTTSSSVVSYSYMTSQDVSGPR